MAADSATSGTAGRPSAWPRRSIAPLLPRSCAVVRRRWLDVVELDLTASTNVAGCPGRLSAAAPGIQTWQGPRDASRTRAKAERRTTRFPSHPPARVPDGLARRHYAQRVPVEGRPFARPIARLRSVRPERWGPLSLSRCGSPQRRARLLSVLLGPDLVTPHQGARGRPPHHYQPGCARLPAA